MAVFVYVLLCHGSSDPVAGAKTPLDLGLYVHRSTPLSVPRLRTQYVTLVVPKGVGKISGIETHSTNSK
jgi:hypothetical protein